MASLLCPSLVLAALATLSSAAPAEKKIDYFTLRDFQGKQHALADVAGKKLVVVAFLGAECPLANRYATRLAELAKKYEPQGVVFFGIDSNQQDSLALIGHLATS